MRASRTTAARSSWRARRATARLEAEALESLAFAEKGFDVERAAEHHEQALAIAEELDGPSAPGQDPQPTGPSTIANDLQLEEALEKGERALALAERTGEEHDRVLAVDALKLVALLRGDLGQLE